MTRTTVWFATAAVLLSFGGSAASLAPIPRMLPPTTNVVENFERGTTGVFSAGGGTNLEVVTNNGAVPAIEGSQSGSATGQESGTGGDTVGGIADLVILFTFFVEPGVYDVSIDIQAIADVQPTVAADASFDPNGVFVGHSFQPAEFKRVAAEEWASPVFTLTAANVNASGGLISGTLTLDGAFRWMFDNLRIDPAVPPPMLVALGPIHHPARRDSLLWVVGADLSGRSFAIDGELTVSLGLSNSIGLIRVPGNLSSGTHEMTEATQPAGTGLLFEVGGADVPGLAAAEEALAFLETLVDSASADGLIASGRDAGRLVDRISTTRAHVRAGRLPASFGQLRALQAEIASVEPGRRLSDPGLEPAGIRIEREFSLGLQFFVELVREYLVIEQRFFSIVLNGPPKICAGESGTYFLEEMPEGGCRFAIAEGGELVDAVADENSISIFPKKDQSGTVTFKVRCGETEETFKVEVGNRKVEIPVCIFIVRHPTGGVKEDDRLLADSFGNLEQENADRKAILDGVNRILCRFCVKIKLVKVIDLELPDERFSGADSNALEVTGANRTDVIKAAEAAAKEAGAEKCSFIIVSNTINIGGKGVNGGTDTGSTVSFVGELRDADVDLAKDREDVDDPGQKFVRTIAHELCHQFGLKDFNDPSQIGEDVLKDSVNTDKSKHLMLPWSFSRPEAKKVTSEEGKDAHAGAEKVLDKLKE